jgi:hypothetical protein
MGEASSCNSFPALIPLSTKDIPVLIAAKAVNGSMRAIVITS